MIIGLSGAINTGKDTVAAILCEEYNFLNVAFADPLKDFCLKMFPDILDEETLWGPSEKRTPECRRLLQQLGTDVARAFDTNVWIKHTVNRIRLLQDDGRDSLQRHTVPHRHCSIVVSDVRFPNEAQSIIDLGGSIIQIVRPLNYDIVSTTDTARTHTSETSLSKIPHKFFAAHITNDKTLHDLETQTRRILLGLLKT